MDSPARELPSSAAAAALSDKICRQTISAAAVGRCGLWCDQIQLESTLMNLACLPFHDHNSLCPHPPPQKVCPTFTTQRCSPLGESSIIHQKCESQCMAPLGTWPQRGQVRPWAWYSVTVAVTSGSSMNWKRFGAGSSGPASGGRGAGQPAQWAGRKCSVC